MQFRQGDNKFVSVPHGMISCQQTNLNLMVTVIPFQDLKCSRELEYFSSFGNGNEVRFGHTVTRSASRRKDVDATELRYRYHIRYKLLLVAAKGCAMYYRFLSA